MRYVAIRSEGGLIPYDLLDKIANEDAAGQKPGDFGLAKGRRLTDEISRVWADAQSLWSNFKRRRDSLGERDPYGTSITRSWIGSLLGDVDMLGFDLKLQGSAVVVNNSTYAISHRSGEGEDAIPVHIEGLKIDLDRRLHTKLRTSPQAMVQDFLNNGEQVLWGIVTNGLSLRILRDSSRTARPTYLEFDLESILEGNRFNEFALLYRVSHRSRFPRPGQDPADCLLERYYQDSVEQGLRVRDKLREGVEETLKILGTAFLQHPGNDLLRGKVSSGQLTAIQFHRQLLLLVYRLLFLMVAEERGLIVSVGENAEPNQRIYDEWYSITRLRDRAAQIIDTSPFGDVWQGLQQTFSLFEYGLDTNPLSIPPLNGDLFHQEHAIPNLKGTELYNHELLRAIRHLSLFKDANIQQRVNYSALDVEELGSVYESLLDYQAVLQPSDKGLVFELRAGAERKSTGSYYTRPELVHELVESALVPIMEDRLAEAEKASEGKNLVEEQKAKIATILNMTVCDPACGSGHFLLAAARRLGKELARIRTGEDEPRPEDFHLAVRDVISHCIYGVDVNPLAVDLCKLALWLEGHWAGKPLSFLDHRLRCGNSLVGVLSPEILAEGIPDEAFTAVTGDDKKAATAFKKQNKQERTSKQQKFFFDEDDHSDEYARAKRELVEIAEDTAASVRHKAELYGSWRAGMQHSHDEAVADLWTAQFFHPLSHVQDPAVCTTGPFLDFAKDAAKQPQRVAAAKVLALRGRFFHWHLEFPEVFDKRGFDVVLGNPPWERIKLQEEEHWLDDSYISHAGNKAIRAKRIEEYRASGDPSKRERIASFDRARHLAESTNKFVRQSGRFPLTAVGDVNTYALFAELARRIVNDTGRAGVIVPTGIATDDTYKHFFADVTRAKGIVCLFDFENRERIFSDVYFRMKFCLLTLTSRAHVSATFAFYLTRVEQIHDATRTFNLGSDDFALLNPNTRTCPVFRTGADADLTKSIYRRVPILVEESTGRNSWTISTRRVFDMAKQETVELARPTSEMSTPEYQVEGILRIDRRTGERYLPVYEGKMFAAYNHRAANVAIIRENIQRSSLGVISEDGDLSNPNYILSPTYWMPETALTKINFSPQWVIGYKDVTSTTNERTMVAAILPTACSNFSVRCATIDSLPSSLAVCLLANFNSLIFDYLARQSLSGLHMSDYILQQIPVIQPGDLLPIDLRFLVPRVLELSYTAWDLAAFAKDVFAAADAELRSAVLQQFNDNGGVKNDAPGWVAKGYPFPPFCWDEPRRAILRAELDAYYAHLYGLTEEELKYVLHPQDVLGANFPGETYRILQERERSEFGEYRTQRLVLTAFGELAKSERFENDTTNRRSIFHSSNMGTSVVGSN